MNLRPEEMQSLIVLVKAELLKTQNYKGSFDEFTDHNERYYTNLIMGIYESIAFKLDKEMKAQLQEPVRPSGIVLHYLLTQKRHHN